MQFTPMIPGNINESLLGVATDNVNFKMRSADEIMRDKSRDFDSTRERAHTVHDNESHANEIKRTIIIVIITAILFVTVVSIFDVVHDIVNNYYADLALTDPDSDNTQENIKRSQIANKETLYSSIAFCLFCIVVSVITIPILDMYIAP